MSIQFPSLRAVWGDAEGEARTAALEPSNVPTLSARGQRPSRGAKSPIGTGGGPRLLATRAGLGWAGFRFQSAKGGAAIERPKTLRRERLPAGKGN